MNFAASAASCRVAALDTARHGRPLVVVVLVLVVEVPPDALGENQHLAVLARPRGKLVHVRHGPDGAVKAPPDKRVVLVGTVEPPAELGTVEGA